MDFKEEIKASPMGRFQIVTLAVCMLTVMIDGYNIAVVAFTAPFIAEEWAVSATSLGLLLAASGVGMAIGSFILSPLADRIGRRRLTLLSLALVCVGATLAMLAPGLGQMFIGRVIAGLGLGGMISTLSVIINEFSNRKRYGLAIGLYVGANSTGSFLGGIVTSALVGTYGWRSAFYVVAGLTYLMTLICALRLPESLDYLDSRRKPNSLHSINKILARMGRRPVAALAEPRVIGAGSKGAFGELFGSIMLPRLILLFIAQIGLAVSFFFLYNWTPRLAGIASGDPTLGVNTGVVMGFGGIVGCILIGIISHWIQQRLLTAVALVLAAVGFIVFGFSVAAGGSLFGMALILGIVANVSVAPISAVGPQLFSAKARASGVGLVTGAQMAAGVVGPILAGVLLDSGWSISSLYIAFAFPLVIGGLACFTLAAVVKRQQSRSLAPAVSGNEQVAKV